MGTHKSKHLKKEENGTTKDTVAKNDFNHGDANDVTGSLNKTGKTSQGLGPSPPLSHQMQPDGGNEAPLTKIHQVPAVDAPQNREQNITKAVNILQNADPVKDNPCHSAVLLPQQHTSPAKPQKKKTSTTKPVLQQATPAKPGPCHGVKTTDEKSDALRSDILQQLQGVTGNLSQQQSGPSAKVLHQAQNILEQSTATKPGIVNVKMPGDDDDETAEATVITVQDGSQQQDCTAMEENTTEIHNKAYLTPQHNKVDNDTNGNTSSGIQTVNMKAALVKADPNNAANNTTAASADSSVKSKVQHKLNVTIILHTATKPQEKGKLKGMEQNHPNKNAGNFTTKEDKNGKNGQDEKQEPDIPPAVPPEHTEGRWHPFTVNQSCSVKVLCKHNPGKGLQPNIQKW